MPLNLPGGSTMHWGDGRGLLWLTALINRYFHSARLLLQQRLCSSTHIMLLYQFDLYMLMIFYTKKTDA